LIGGSKTTLYGGIGGGGGEISLQGGQGRDASNDPSGYAPVLLQSNGGNVGIGTNYTPDRLFEVFGSAPIFRFRDSGATASATTAFIEFGGTDGGNWNRTGYIGDGQSANKDLLLVAEAGDLRLGDSSSEYVLTLSGGDAIFTGNITANTINADTLISDRFQSADDSNSYIAFMTGQWDFTANSVSLLRFDAGLGTGIIELGELGGNTIRIDEGNAITTINHNTEIGGTLSLLGGEITQVSAIFDSTDVGIIDGDNRILQDESQNSVCDFFTENLFDCLDSNITTTATIRGGEALFTDWTNLTDEFGASWLSTFNSTYDAKPDIDRFYNWTDGAGATDNFKTTGNATAGNFLTEGGLELSSSVNEGTIRLVKYDNPFQNASSTIQIGNDGNTDDAILIVANSTGTGISKINQDVRTQGSPTFQGLTVNTGVTFANLILDGSNAVNIFVADGNDGAPATGSPATDGQGFAETTGDGGAGFSHDAADGGSDTIITGDGGDSISTFDAGNGGNRTIQLGIAGVAGGTGENGVDGWFNVIGKSIFSDVIFADRLVLGQTNESVNSTLNIGSGDIVADIVYANAFMGRSPPPFCDLEDLSCAVFFPKYQKTLWIDINKDWTINKINLDEQDYTTQEFNQQVCSLNENTQKIC
ncbi:hypothetical protein LCGC14_2158180, partial [marine sediment metagenome]